MILAYYMAYGPINQLGLGSVHLENESVIHALMNSKGGLPGDAEDIHKDGLVLTWLIVTF